MNILRVVVAAVGAFVAYFVIGGLTFGLLPFLQDEFRKYPGVYRPAEAMKSFLPVGMAAMFLAVLALAVIYALIYKGSSGLAEGARFGALIGVFAFGAFVMHNYVNLNIGLTLTLQSAAAYFVEWTAVGLVIGLIYRPARR